MARAVAAVCRYNEFFSSLLGSVIARGRSMLGIDLRWMTDNSPGQLKLQTLASLSENCQTIAECIPLL